MDPITVLQLLFQSIGVAKELKSLLSSPQREQAEADGLLEKLNEVLEESKVRRNEIVGADYKLLGCEEDSAPEEVRARYRHLIKVFDLNSLEGKGLPDELVELTVQRVREIHVAYDRIMRHEEALCKVQCPHCEGEIFVEGDGEYTCPWCEESVGIAHGVPIGPGEVKCPHCGEICVIDGEGEYTCPECEEDFVVGSS